MKFFFVQSNWLHVRSNLVPGLTHGRLTEKNYLQAWFSILIPLYYRVQLYYIPNVPCAHDDGNDIRIIMNNNKNSYHHHHHPCNQCNVVIIIIIWPVRPSAPFHCKTIDKIPIWGLYAIAWTWPEKAVRPC